MLSKFEARQEVLRRWRSLPPRERLDVTQALSFARSIAKSIEFETLGTQERIIEAWLIKEVEHAQTFVKPVPLKPFVPKRWS